MNIEARLTAKIGNTGKKLHTGRSRNDQVATDIRLYLRDEIDVIDAELTRLREGMLGLAEQEADTIMPGFTHLQSAQPVTFGHHLLAWQEMVARDQDRLRDCRTRMNVLPLGAAALAGTTFPIDRHVTTELLGFDRPTENSLDSVSDRDFAIEFTSFASLLMMHLSRMSEELVLWTSAQFDFIDLPDRFWTGSSIMPQKKNPDVPELVRGKTGRVYGHLMSLLTLMKSAAAGLQQGQSGRQGAAVRYHRYRTRQPARLRRHDSRRSAPSPTTCTPRPARASPPRLTWRITWCARVSPSGMPTRSSASPSPSASSRSVTCPR